jgi:Flp pilus assembly protein CpaB
MLRPRPGILPVLLPPTEVEHAVAAPKRSNNLLIVIGLVLLIVGAGLVVVLLRNNDDGSDGGTNATNGSDLVDVVVSKRAIPSGTSSKDLADAVEVKKVPAVSRPSDALTTLGDLAEKTTTVDIGAGQPLRLAFFKDIRIRTLQVPAGKQGFAVTVDFTPAGAGYVGPGDLVNVFANLTTRGGTVVPPCGNGVCDAGPNQPVASSQLVLSAVQVLDVSQEIAQNAGSTTASTVAGTRSRPSTGAAPITYLLAVDSAQAEKLVFFTTYTDLYLSLLPKDTAPASGAARDQTNATRP